MLRMSSSDYSTDEKLKKVEHVLKQVKMENIKGVHV